MNSGFDGGRFMFRGWRRPSPATVIASIALFVALGSGSAFALRGTNTVNSGDIINGQVKAKDVHDLRFSTLALENGWTPLATFNGSAPGRAKDGFGIVHLRGEIHQSTGSSVE